jgi:hypothetical protein
VAPGLRATTGARSALMAATRDRGMEARGPYRSVARSRKRPVLVAFPGTVPLPRPGRLGAGGGARRGARRPGATGHSASTQARNPARVEAGASTRRSSHRARPPTVASGVGVSAASAMPSWRWRAMAQARTTANRVSLARAYATGGRAQMARFRQPGAAAIAFMNTLVPTAARFRARARRARRPCRASAMPRQANTMAAASGMAASRAAITGRCRAASAIRYWAVKLTTAAAAARTPRPAAALRSHRPERSSGGPGWRPGSDRTASARPGGRVRIRTGPGGGGWPAPAAGTGTSGIGRVMAGRLSGEMELGISYRPLRSGGLPLRSPGG